MAWEQTDKKRPWSPVLFVQNYSGGFDQDFFSEIISWKKKSCFFCQWSMKVIKLNLTKMNNLVFQNKIETKKEWIFLLNIAVLLFYLKVLKCRKNNPYLFVYFLQWQLCAKLLSLFYAKLKYLKAESFCSGNEKIHHSLESWQKAICM